MNVKIVDDYTSPYAESIIKRYIKAYIANYRHECIYEWQLIRETGLVEFHIHKIIEE